MLSTKVKCYALKRLTEDSPKLIRFLGSRGIAIYGFWNSAMDENAAELSLYSQVHNGADARHLGARWGGHSWWGLKPLKVKDGSWLYLYD